MQWRFVEITIPVKVTRLSDEGDEDFLFEDTYSKEHQLRFVPRIGDTICLEEAFEAKVATVKFWPQADEEYIQVITEPEILYEDESNSLLEDGWSSQNKRVAEIYEQMMKQHQLKGDT